MKGHQIIIQRDGVQITTLADILPEKPGLRILFVAKTPAPISVEAGHYFQGRQGTAFWNMLQRYGLLKVPPGQFQDECLLQHGYGLTDIVKVPRAYGNEPDDSEYAEGRERILNLIALHRPKATIFVYKGVLSQLLRDRGKRTRPSSYGFNPELEARFGCKVFVFPMPGTQCNKTQAIAAMKALCGVLL